ncbi:SNF2 family N-terminal domain-containing protein [Piptocephalis cylindrospora]|uniref:SNF2 family N-terminal domain-containing protein n=1 Tax=Piptocephalis cylindrospora TaxID=1907219 RepID=A0A4P9Y810_9FUNG|nr:SNF2 family N-terminal domain-containing protein [Piptocephalis cylindrospora]|eukprot:RKP15145.1 SNF2 family N-terminal domain-containing protein [Piptocephalis cylindrospora]
MPPGTPGQGTEANGPTSTPAVPQLHPSVLLAAAAQQHTQQQLHVSLPIMTLFSLPSLPPSFSLTSPSLLSLPQRLQALAREGANEQNNQEFAELLNRLRTIRQAQMMVMQQQHLQRMQMQQQSGQVQQPGQGQQLGQGQSPLQPPVASSSQATEPQSSAQAPPPAMNHHSPSVSSAASHRKLSHTLRLSSSSSSLHPAHRSFLTRHPLVEQSPSPGPTTPSSPFPNANLATLRNQIQAFKLLYRGLPVPAEMQQAIFGQQQQQLQQQQQQQQQQQGIPFSPQGSAPNSESIGPSSAPVSSIQPGSFGQIPAVAARISQAAAQIPLLHAQTHPSSAPSSSMVNGHAPLAAAQPPSSTPATSAPSALTPAPLNPHGLPNGMGTTPSPAPTHPAPSQSTPASAPRAAVPADPHDPSSYGSYLSPYAYILAATAPGFPQASRRQRLLIPGLLPIGLDPERRIRARITARTTELKDLPANLGPEGKMRAVVELKGLGLLERQRRLRAELGRGMRRATTLLTAADRHGSRRPKRAALREARVTERLERQQRAERERRRKARAAAHLETLLQHGRELREWSRSHAQRGMRLGRSVLQYHGTAEREEARARERMARARIRALQSNDEEAYKRLLVESKDSRLQDLLSQTDRFLSELAGAVQEQQRSDGPEVQAAAFHTDTESPGQDGGEVDYYGVAHRIREKVTEQSSLLVGGKLKDYQVKGLEWMVSLYNNRLNGILADEMGLGKTIQTISLITFLIEHKRQNGPFLVIVPLSTITNWTLEFEKWAPAVATIVYKGTPGQRRDIQQTRLRHGSFQVLLTTYEYILKDRPLLCKYKWVHMIIDEGHRMKNASSKLSSTLQKYYHTRYRLILTGTPLQNNLPELWALLNFVLPRVFKSAKSFDEWFAEPMAAAGAGDEQRVELKEEEQLLIIQRLHKVLRPFLLRRLKKDVESELPDKVETVVRCGMSALQAALALQEGRAKVRGMNNTIMQLRKICNHPFVFQEVEDIINPGHRTNEMVWRASGKFELLDRMLPKFFSSNHKVLMFFQMTRIMDIMEDYMLSKGWGYLRLDGTTKSDDRTAMLGAFNAPDSPYQCFLLSTRAGGLGLNLQTADTVVIFDSDWNPHQDLQAQDRAHRIGQTKEVRIYRLITEGSVEEQILARAHDKLDMDGKVIQAEREAFLRALLNDTAGGFPSLNKSSDKGKGADGSGKGSEAEGEDMFEAVMPDDELVEICARSDEERIVFTRSDREREELRSEAWHLAHRGEVGGPPRRLMQADEIPDWMLKFDEEEEENGEGEGEESIGDDGTVKVGRGSSKYGRGRRERQTVHYDDGLTEEQYLDAIEAGEDPMEVMEARAEAKRRRAEAKRLREMAEVDDAEAVEEEEEEDEGGESEDKERGREKSEEEDEDGSIRQGGKRRNLPVKGSVKRPSSSIHFQDGDGHLPPQQVKVETHDGPHRDSEDLSSGSGRKAGRVGGKRSRGGGGGSKKRRTQAPPPPPAPLPRSTPAPPLDGQPLGDEIVEEILEAVEADMDPRYNPPLPRCTLFLELPSRQDYPDYYDVIQRPVSLEEIRDRAKAGVYHDDGGLLQKDFATMWANARQYNVEGSEVCENATILEGIVHGLLTKWVASQGEEEGPSSEGL